MLSSLFVLFFFFFASIYVDRPDFCVLRQAASSSMTVENVKHPKKLSRQPYILLLVVPSVTN